MNSKKKTIIESVVTTVLLGLLIYASYSLWYVFYGTDSDFEVHLYTILSGSALGWFLALLVGAIFQKANWIPKLIAFIAGNGFFQGLIWGFNAKLNPTCTDNEPVVIKTYTIVFIMSALSLLVAFILRAKKGLKLSITAVLTKTATWLSRAVKTKNTAILQLASTTTIST